MLNDKHEKYYSSYIPNDTFWGIGIETETYLEFEKPYGIVTDDISTRLKRDPYSVDYFEIYDMYKFNETLSYLFFPFGYQKKNGTPYWYVPFMINAYTLQNVTLSGFHDSLSGMYKNMCLYDIYFSNKFEKEFAFDGDSIEFMTLKFYKTTVDNVCKELYETKKEFLLHVNSFFSSHLSCLTQKYGKLSYPSKNHGMVSFLSNKGYISICNNSTYHFNLTLPTKLDINGCIQDKYEFELVHSNAIRVIQIALPLLVGTYGTGDFLHKEDNIYVKGSLRAAVSRYISVGTYDVETMPTGKHLDSYPSDYCLWYTLLKENTKGSYNLLKYIGYDFNFNKFKNHGIELRALDWFPDKHIPHVLNFIILLCSFSLDGQRMMEFKRLLSNYPSFIYQTIIYGCIKDGGNFSLSYTQDEFITNLFGISTKTHQRFSCFEILCMLNDHLYDLYKDSYLVSLMSPNMQKPQLFHYNQEIT